MDVVFPKAGKYVLAVSGGVDSVSLMHMLKDRPGVEVVVAHFDHGIRPDSGEDRELVREVAEIYELPFEYAEGRLGPAASEAVAREARYAFLRDVLRRTEAQALITAHHRDDVLETAIINLVRGGGRKGLTALDSRPGVERPLLDVPKRDIISYAEKQGLRWREDSTNQDIDYLRNYVRHRLLPRFSQQEQDRLWAIIKDLRRTNREIDTLLDAQFSQVRTDGIKLDRQWFIRLPHAVALEAMAAWLRDNGVRDFDGKTLERLVVAAKTAGAGKRFDVLHGRKMSIHGRYLALTPAER
jgi:tRNA(Ile)-lysidine synthase